eukprot:328290-Pyramimonas_sp.AAC.1
MYCHSIRFPCGASTPGDPRKGGAPEKLVEKNTLFHLHSGHQHEARHRHSIRFPYGASTPGDPRRVGHQKTG